MRIDKRFMKSSQIYSLSFLFFFIFNASVAFAENTANGRDYHLLSRETGMFKILSALENKTEVKNLPAEEKSKLLGKAKNKLFTLDDRELRLLVSLSDRITNNGRTPAGDVAFLLITALIVLS